MAIYQIMHLHITMGNFTLELAALMWHHKGYLMLAAGCMTFLWFQEGQTSLFPISFAIKKTPCDAGLLPGLLVCKSHFETWPHRFPLPAIICDMFSSSTVPWCEQVRDNFKVGISWRTSDIKVSLLLPLKAWSCERNVKKSGRPTAVPVQL